jgi:quinol monooxygenase YgiN
MVSLTAVIRCKAGSKATIREALLKVAAHASENEPGTISYFVSETSTDVFITHERYRDQQALDTHNEGVGAKRFFAEAESALDKVEVYIGPEILPG